MKSDKILLLVAALFGTLDVVATYVVGSSLIMNFVDSGESVLLHTTLFLFLYSLLFGAYLSFIPRKELRGKNRHEMMKTQGGAHSNAGVFFRHVRSGGSCSPSA